MMRQGLRGEIEHAPAMDDQPVLSLEGNTENILVGKDEWAVMNAAFEAENVIR